jgi:hypothetical protein
LVTSSGCVLRGQRYRNFITPAPLPVDNILVLGFMGGVERWDNPRSVRHLALALRARNDPKLHVETVENRKRSLALQLVRNTLDRNLDRKLDQNEKASARIIVYGQSFGGAAVVKFARQLDSEGIPVLLTVQVDSVGRGDRVIPPNVARAANLYQSNGRLIRGEPLIEAKDQTRTRILGNFRFDYQNKQIDLSKVPWFKKAFRVAHTRMEYDPDVWKLVEKLILDEIVPAK